MITFLRKITLSFMSLFLFVFCLIGQTGWSNPEIIELEYGPSKKVKFFRDKNLVAVRAIENRRVAVFDQEDALSSFESQNKIDFSPEGKDLLEFKMFRYQGSQPLQDKIEEIVSISQNQVQFMRVFHTNLADTTPFVPTGFIHLKFKSSSDSEECSSILEKHHLEISKVIGSLEFFVKLTNNHGDPVQLSVDILLQHRDSIELAVADFVTPIKNFTYPPSNSEIEGQWHLENIGTHRGTSVGLKKGADARIKAAWNYLNSVALSPFGSEDIKIAIIDDGFDIYHPGLGGKNPSKIVVPYDYSKGRFSDVCFNHLGKEWHGTAVAGIAAALDDEGPVVGVAPRAKIIPIRYGKGISSQEIANWFEYAEKQGAHIINCSWGPEAKEYHLQPYVDSLFTRLTTQAREGKGITIVFAAGNDNRNVNDPYANSVNGLLTHPNVIAVAASNSRDQKSHYSNYGEEISVCAPSSGHGGMGIRTANVRALMGYNQLWDYVDDFGGTSSAAPVVSGVAALMLSAHSNLTTQEIKDILKQTARPIHPTSVPFGSGCVNAEEAIKKVLELYPIQVREREYRGAYKRFSNGLDNGAPFGALGGFWVGASIGGMVGAGEGYIRHGIPGFVGGAIAGGVGGGVSLGVAGFGVGGIVGGINELVFGWRYYNS